MRRRGYAVHAADFDEYKVVSKAKDLFNDPSSSSPYQLASSSSVEPVQQSSRQIEREMKRADPNLWNDFNFQSKPAEDQEGSDDCSQASTADMESSGSRLSGDFGAKSTVQVSNYMVIGSQETQIRRILDNLFESEPVENQSQNAMLDLVIKEQEVQGQQYKMKFWIQDPTHQRHEAILQTYYTANKTYFFVYRPDNRNSFECLAAAMEKVKARLAAGNFTGFLVCDNKNIEDYEVFEEEAEKLVERFGLAGKLETGNSLVDFKKHVYQTLV